MSPDQKPTVLPQAAYQQHDNTSWGRKDGAVLARLNQMKFSEIEFTMAMAMHLARDEKTIEGIERARSSNEALGYESASAIATTESAVILFKYPNLVGYLPTLPSLYRLSRTAELMGYFKRGGDTLLVGSGTTINEVVALDIVPPTVEDLTDFANLNLRAIRDDIITTFPQLGGTYEAVEPSARGLLTFERSKEDITIDPNKVVFHNCTIGEALNSGVLKGNYENVVMNRVEPAIATGKLDTKNLKGKQKVQQARAIRGFLSAMADNLRSGGCLAVTIGSGGDFYQFDARKKFLAEARSKALDLKFTIAPGLPMSTEDNHEIFLYALGDSGKFGCFFAKKPQS